MRGADSEGTGVLCGEGGFTLIETILTLSILVILLGLVLSSLRIGVMSWERGETAVAEAASRRFIAKRFSTDAGSMYLSKEKKGGRSVYGFNAHTKEFGFVTANRIGTAGLPWGGARYVRYFVDKNGLNASYKMLPDYEGALEPTPINLEPDVSSISFNYLGEGGWVNAWNLAQRKRLPRAVRAAFTFDGDASPLVVTVPVGVTRKVSSSGRGASRR